MKMRYRQAIGRALADAMESDDRVVVLGEDVGSAGRAFKVTEGLQKRLGVKRCIGNAAADVIDLSWLMPWDVDRVLARVPSTGVLVTVE